MAEVDNAAREEEEEEKAAQEDEEEENAGPTRPAESEIRSEFPAGRVKRIMKLDRDINKVNSEALRLVSCSAQLFLEFLAERSAEVAAEKKRKVVKLEHMRIAVKRHRPTNDFLIDELPVPSQPSDRQVTDRSRSATVDNGSASGGRVRSRSRTVAESPAPAGTRRIDHVFHKRAEEAPVQTEEAPIETEEAAIETEEAPVEAEEAPVEAEEDEPSTEIDEPKKP